METVANVFNPGHKWIAWYDPPFKSPLLVGLVHLYPLLCFLSLHFYLNAINGSSYRNKPQVEFQFWEGFELIKRYRELETLGPT